MIVMQTPDELLYLLYIPRDKRDTVGHAEFPPDRAFGKKRHTLGRKASLALYNGGRYQNPERAADPNPDKRFAAGSAGFSHEFNRRSGEWGREDLFDSEHYHKGERQQRQTSGGVDARIRTRKVAVRDFIERDDEVLGAAHTLAAHARGNVSVYERDSEIVFFSISERTPQFLLRDSRGSTAERGVWKRELRRTADVVPPCGRSRGMVQKRRRRDMGVGGVDRKLALWGRWQMGQFLIEMNRPQFWVESGSSQNLPWRGNLACLARARPTICGGLRNAQCPGPYSRLMVIKMYRVGTYAIEYLR
ncbi:hypothetical protein B0H13DRAFT_1880323 [Mycena leptocephala]|nr:hypothetical protein B0H13DRAFT_1880323 [Mycena leptocephala]